MSAPARARWTAIAVAATFAFFPLYSTLGLLYEDPHNTALPPSVWLLPRPIVWAFAIASVAAFATIVAGAVRWRSPLPAMVRPGAAGVLAFLIAGAFGFEPASGLVFTLGFVLWMLAGNALIAVARTVRWAGDASLIAFLASGALACAFSLVLVAARKPAALYAFHHGRAVGTFLNTNELAGYAVVLCATACGAAIVARDGRMRVLAIVAFVCGAGALLATFSRSGFIGAFVAAVVFVVALRPRRALAFASIAVLVAVLAGAALFDAHHNPAESLSRLPAWTAGWRTFELFPLTGVGPIAYYRTYPFARPPDGPAPGTPISFDPHNLFLTFFSEFGLVGTALFAWMWWQWVVLYRRALADAFPRRRPLVVAIAAGLAGLWAVSVFNTLSIVFALWGDLMALALVSGRDD